MISTSEKGLSKKEIGPYYMIPNLRISREVDDKMVGSISSR